MGKMLYDVITENSRHSACHASVTVATMEPRFCRVDYMFVRLVSRRFVLGKLQNFSSLRLIDVQRVQDRQASTMGSFLFVFGIHALSP
ncbi:unnamed protein product [Peronospora belbahrii]|uniref:Uncharacterized protein n=1 Tax=Peronospora belbahrii TaxID=622444 RepID=A0AAU9KXY5_9STRA|nr:unnamed protein product [Peronospora belbahrii]